jgi:hypothetical protein
MTSALTVPGNDPFRAFVSNFDATASQGKLVKFSKGFYMAGADNEEVARGSTFTARVDLLTHGWTRWESQRPVEHAVGKVSEGFIPATRQALGHTDERLWESDREGQPRDPWTFGYSLPLEDGENKYVFVTSSFGGKRAIRNLIDAYTRRKDAGSLPVIALDVNQRKHKVFGNIPEPLFEIHGWTDAPVAANGKDLDDEIPF